MNSINSKNIWLLTFAVAAFVLSIAHGMRIHKLDEEVKLLRKSSSTQDNAATPTRIIADSQTDTILSTYFENIRTKNKAMTNFDSHYVRLPYLNKIDSLANEADATISSDGKNWFVSWLDKHTQLFGFVSFPKYVSYEKCLEVCDSLNKIDTVVQHAPMIDLKAAERYMLLQARVKYLLSE
jgi:hypothetical protein